MSLKAIAPLPKQYKEHPEQKQRLRGVISQKDWERKTIAARRFKPEAK